MDYQHLTIKHALGLAAPHTWVASVFPVLLGTALSFALTGQFSVLIFLLLLAASVLLQSSVNTINDYYDFVKGTDNLENSDDPSDAILIYNNINPRSVIGLGVCYMGIAILFGLYPVYRGGLDTLLLGVIGCFVIIAYSAGPHPISSLPLGEPVSGIVMGGLLTAAAFSAFTGSVPPKVFLLSLPLILAIGLIMMTNNICDIERDTVTSRKTLPVCLGRPRARLLYRIISALWILLILALILIYFPKGILVTGVILILSIPVWLKLFRASFVPELRGAGMGTIVKSNLCLNCAYIGGIAAQIVKGLLN
ncbi:MAG: prenyltransferase [Clostridiales Family XIII bacterium]|jgi:1,4-dihydroxy-2-naphthoate octaprenyltransferase|nr:prenyltransferase [Clostridiales Family XIII bacterium]